jgi:hypothetical protein
LAHALLFHSNARDVSILENGMTRLIVPSVVLVLLVAGCGASAGWTDGVSGGPISDDSLGFVKVSAGLPIAFVEAQVYNVDQADMYSLTLGGRGFPLIRDTWALSLGAGVGSIWFESDALPDDQGTVGYVAAGAMMALGGKIFEGSWLVLESRYRMTDLRPVDADGVEVMIGIQSMKPEFHLMSGMSNDTL